MYSFGHYSMGITTYFIKYHSINRKGNKRKEVVGRNTNFVLLVIYVTICHRKVIRARNALVYTSMQRPMDRVMETQREPWSGPERALDWPMETHGLGHSLCSLVYGSLWASPRLGSRDPWTGPQRSMDWATDTYGQNIICCLDSLRTLNVHHCLSLVTFSCP